MNDRYWSYYRSHKRQSQYWSHWSNRYRSHRTRRQIQETRAMNDRRYRYDWRATNNKYWSHKRQPMEPQATDSGTGDTHDRYWSHKRSTDTVCWSHSRTRWTTDTGATNDKGHKRQRIHWSHRTRRQILEPGATDTGAMNDRRYRYYWSHKRLTDTGDWSHERQSRRY